MKAPLFFLGTHLVNPAVAAMIEWTDAEVVFRLPNGAHEGLAGVTSEHWGRFSASALEIAGYVELGSKVLVNPRQINCVKDPSVDDSASIEVGVADDTFAVDFPTEAEAKKVYDRFVMKCVLAAAVEPLSRSA